MVEFDDEGLLLFDDAKVDVAFSVYVAGAVALGVSVAAVISGVAVLALDVLSVAVAVVGAAVDAPSMVDGGVVVVPAAVGVGVLVKSRIVR